MGGLLVDAAAVAAAASSTWRDCAQSSFTRHLMRTCDAITPVPCITRGGAQMAVVARGRARVLVTFWPAPATGRASLGLVKFLQAAGEEVVMDRTTGRVISLKGLPSARQRLAAAATAPGLAGPDAYAGSCGGIEAVPLACAAAWLPPSHAKARAAAPAHTAAVPQPAGGSHAAEPLRGGCTQPADLCSTAGRSAACSSTCSCASMQLPLPLPPALPAGTLLKQRAATVLAATTPGPQPASTAVAAEPRPATLRGADDGTAVITLMGCAAPKAARPKPAAAAAGLRGATPFWLAAQLVPEFDPADCDPADFEPPLSQLDYEQPPRTDFRVACQELDSELQVGQPAAAGPGGTGEAPPSQPAAGLSPGGSLPCVASPRQRVKVPPLDLSLLAEPQLSEPQLSEPQPQPQSQPQPVAPGCYRPPSTNPADRPPGQQGEAQATRGAARKNWQAAQAHARVLSAATAVRVQMRAAREENQAEEAARQAWLETHGYPRGRQLWLLSSRGRAEVRAAWAAARAAWPDKLRQWMRAAGLPSQPLAAHPRARRGKAWAV